VSTASRNCRIHQQRLQAARFNARAVSGSFGSGPWALRPKRLQWLTNITAEFKIAAFFQRHMHLSEKKHFSGACVSQVSSRMALYHTSLSICGLEAVAGTFPPFLFFKLTHGPPSTAHEKNDLSQPVTPWLANGWLGVIGRWSNSK
jgi:hypothetical protein